jgi:hypothetical protein
LSEAISKAVPFELQAFKKNENAFQQRLNLLPQEIDKKFGNIKAVLNVAYYIAKYNKPFSDIVLADKLGICVCVRACACVCVCPSVCPSVCPFNF